MPTLISYIKHIDAIHTRTLTLPDAAQGQQAAQELATLSDGRTIVVLFDGHTLPANQPAEIAASIETLASPLDKALREQIKAASPMCKLINNMVQAKIADRYSMTDEIKLLRTAPSSEMDIYDAFAEECRAWGQAEKAKLGL